MRWIFDVIEEYRNLGPIRYWIVAKLNPNNTSSMPKNIGPFYSQDIAQEKCNQMNNKIEG